MVELVNRHPRVRESVVMAIDGTEGEKRLVGYVVLRNEGSAGSTTITDLRGFLGRTIPEYMIPVWFCGNIAIDDQRQGGSSRLAYARWNPPSAWPAICQTPE